MDQLTDIIQSFDYKKNKKIILSYIILTWKRLYNILIISKIIQFNNNYNLLYKLTYSILLPGIIYIKFNIIPILHTLSTT
jgi:hypothetical protein